MPNNSPSKIVNYNILNLSYNITKDTVLIFMPTYNRTEYIINSLESLVKQDYHDVLIHVIDDNSDQDVIGLITDYIVKNNIKNVILSKNNINSGAYIALNNILNYHINDDFGYWLLQGSDDVSDKQRVSKLVNFFNENPQFYSCRSKYVVDKELLIPKYGDSMLMNRKQVFFDIGYYDNNRFGGDSDYTMRVHLKYGTIGQVPETLYYGNSGNNRLTKKYTKKKRDEYIDTITKEHRKSLYRDFIDVNRDSIVCGLSTMKSRKNGLQESVESIINQVDKLIVYQNGYYEIFDFLRNPKIEVISSLHTGVDMGDAGKFYKVSNYSNCYYFSIDDDLVYPSNYVINTISNLNRWDNDIIVSYHGRTLKSDATSYYRDCLKLNHCLRYQKYDEFLHFGGTGVMCFHTNKVKVNFEYFKIPNMADIWMGKFAQDNDIKILTLKHNKDWIKETQHKDEYTIYNANSNREFGAAEIIKTFDKSSLDKLNDDINNKFYELSIIIPTFNHTDYLVECLESVSQSVKDVNCEILVGIDSCEKTLELVEKNTFDDKIKFFYFKNNVGPYVIKNTLSLISNSDYLLYFDSDDIATHNLINVVLDNKNKFKVIKPRYIDFDLSVKNINGTKEQSKKYGEGVFAIEKELFHVMNGFEGWRCAADSDFMGRLYKNNLHILHTNEICFYRRLHPGSLTRNSDTSYSSKMRSEYVNITRNKKDFGPLKQMVVGEYNSLTNKPTKVEVKVETKVETKVEVPVNFNKKNDSINIVQVIRPTNSQKLEMLKNIPYIKHKNNDNNGNPVNINESSIIIVKTISATNSKLFKKKRR